MFTKLERVTSAQAILPWAQAHSPPSLLRRAGLFANDRLTVYLGVIINLSVNLSIALERQYALDAQTVTYLDTRRAAPSQ